MIKNPPALWETWVRSQGWEDPLAEGMATHSSILAWRIPWTEELAGYSLWGCKDSDTTEATKHAHGVHRRAANTGIAAQWIFKTAHNQIADTQIRTQPCSLPEAPPSASSRS